MQAGTRPLYGEPRPYRRVLLTYAHDPALVMDTYLADRVLEVGRVYSLRMGTGAYLPWRVHTIGDLAMLDDQAVRAMQLKRQATRQ